MKEIECEVIRDLCPLYEKGEVSEVTKKVIEAHVDDCVPCKTYYEQSKAENELKKQQQEAYYTKAASKLRVKKRVFLLKGLAIFSVFLIAFNSLFHIGRMVTRQMSPTVNEGDVYVINKKAYLFANPEKDDLIYYNNSQYLYNALGRIIGCPGDHIVIKEGKLYINDALYVRYSAQKVSIIDLKTFQETEKLDVLLGEDEYFIMGDNVENACDSRQYGTFKRENIKGKIMLILPREHQEVQQETALRESR